MMKASTIPRDEEFEAAGSDLASEREQDVRRQRTESPQRTQLPTAQSTAAAIALEVLRAVQQAHACTLKNLNEQAQLQERLATSVSALMWSGGFRFVSDIDRSAEEMRGVPQQAVEAAKRSIAERIMDQSADTRRARLLTKNAYKMSAMLMAEKSRRQTYDLIARICVDVARNVEQILRAAGAVPEEESEPRKLNALRAAMIESEQTRSAVQMSVFRTGARRPTSSDTSKSSALTLAALSDFVKFTVTGGAPRMRASTADDCMRAFIADHRMAHPSHVSITHFETLLGRRWGIDGIFRMSGGVLMLDDQIYAAATMTASAAAP